MTEEEWGDILRTLPETPETADGWELSLVRRTVDKVIDQAEADAWDAAAQEGFDGGWLHEPAFIDLKARNPYRKEQG